jgi:hypothetical protein
VGKWGKKKSSTLANSQTLYKQSKNEEQSNLEATSKANKAAEEPKETEEEGMTLSEAELQTLEREVILPLNLPEFFKRKEPHRLIICYFEKCNSVLKKLTREITSKKQVVELDNLDEWTPNPTSDAYLIYVAPMAMGKEKLILRML